MGDGELIAPGVGPIIFDLCWLHWPRNFRLCGPDFQLGVLSCMHDIVDPGNISDWILNHLLAEFVGKANIYHTWMIWVWQLKGQSHIRSGGCGGTRRWWVVRSRAAKFFWCQGWHLQLIGVGNIWSLESDGKMGVANFPHQKSVVSCNTIWSLKLHLPFILPFHSWSSNNIE